MESCNTSAPQAMGPDQKSTLDERHIGSSYDASVVNDRLDETVNIQNLEISATAAANDSPSQSVAENTPASPVIPNEPPPWTGQFLSSSHERLLQRVPLRSPQPFNPSVKLLRQSQSDFSPDTPEMLKSCGTFPLPSEASLQNTEEGKLEDRPLPFSPSAPSILPVVDPLQLPPPRERDPLRLSRYLVFPNQVGHHGAEVHLFDGLVCR